MKKARVLQIGVGNWGVHHKRILSEMGVLKGTVDINGEEDYVDIPDVTYDHVVICTPPDTHYELARKMLIAGKHVFVEKPLAMNSSQCRVLLNIAKEEEVKLQCGYIERFNSLVPKITVPTPRFLRFVRNNRHYPHVKDNIVMDTAVHDIDLALWIYHYEPISIQSVVSDDYCSIILEFPNGTASINCSWLSSEKVRTINGISTITSEDSLKAELFHFIAQDKLLCSNALNVQRVVERILK